MTRFTYGDVVRVALGAPQDTRPGAKAWIVGVVEAGQRRGRHFEQFTPGPGYTIEFEDGISIDVDESSLEPAELGKDDHP